MGLQWLNHSGVGQLELLGPALATGVEERSDAGSLRVEEAGVAALIPIAVGAGQAQAAFRGRPITQRQLRRW